MGFKVRVRESELPKWIEYSEGIVCPLDLFKEELVEVQCWRPSTGKPQLLGASGVSPYVG